MERPSGEAIRFSIVVEEESEGTRLDRFLAQESEVEFSRTSFKKLIAEGFISVEGKRVKPSYKLRAGQTVEVTIPPPKELSLEPKPIPLDILYQDQHLLVVDKPAGLVVHPGAGGEEETLVHALLYHCRDLSSIGGVARPGIVHRLDRDTSGLLVVAKDDLTHRKLSQLFKEKPKDKLDRRYLAVIRGHLEKKEGTIDTFYGRHPHHRKKFSSKFPSSRRAVTHYRVLEEFRWASLVEVRLETGRTHQIRVHFSDLGHPLVGEQVYGSKVPRDWPESIRNFPRQALHAYKLAFQHPISSEFMEFSSPLPPDIQELIDFLRGESATS